MYKSISKLQGNHLTAANKRHILAIINANNPAYLGTEIKANRLIYKIEKLKTDEFSVENIEYKPSVFTGEIQRMVYKYIVKLK